MWISHYKYVWWKYFHAIGKRFAVVLKPVHSQAITNQQSTNPLVIGLFYRSKTFLVSWRCVLADEADGAGLAGGSAEPDGRGSVERSLGWALLLRVSWPEHWASFIWLLASVLVFSVKYIIGLGLLFPFFQIRHATHIPLLLIRDFACFLPPPLNDVFERTLLLIGLMILQSNLKIVPAPLERTNSFVWIRVLIESPDLGIWGC